ncbi:SET domain-containing protein [Aureobasidium sp. EXF-8846]|nr:SET domain-containing protein [Aureobasidium sp. EXF-8846]
MLFPEVSVVQTEKKKKRRGGKKEQIKRQRRQERDFVDDNTRSDDTEDVEMPAFETRRAGGKGLGLFAIRDIDAGERLIQEAPLFILPKQDTMDAAIVESFMHLQPEQRATYLDLSSYTTCTANTQSQVAETSVAEDGTTNLPDVELSRSLVDENGFPIDCKVPNSVSDSVDLSLKDSCKLELLESEAMPSKSLVHQSRVDSPVWDVDDLREAFQSTTTDSDVEGGVDAPDNDTDDCEMTESLAAHVVNIWRTNSYMLDDGITLDYAGIGLTASRLNHSCIPNVYTAYNSTSGCITVQAIKPIAAGDELFTAYISGAGKLRSERRAELSMWGFTCTCIACADGRDESRRREIKALMTKVEGVKKQLIQGSADLSVAQIEQTVGDLLDQATLMSDEGLLGPDLADICFGAARCCLLVDRHEEAGALQTSGFDILLRGYGIDNPICAAALQAGDLDEA